MGKLCNAYLDLLVFPSVSRERELFCRVYRTVILFVLKFVEK